MEVPIRIRMLAVIASVAAGCASGQVQGSISTGGTTPGSTTAPAGGAGGSLTVTLPDAASGGSTTSTGGRSSDGAVPCTDGETCVCPTLNVAVVGKPGVWGDSSDTAFQNWLNSNSAGTAKVDNFVNRPTFTSDFLAGYNVIILASLGDHSANGPWWTFSASELEAFQDWIENKGGGVISLSGYSSDSNEINAKNALVAFSGISYKQENISPACLVEDAQRVKMCYRCGNPYQIAEWNRTDPAISKLGFGVTMIGIDGGHPIFAPADAYVAAMTTTATTVNNWLVGKIVGKGRVLVYADEWITYTNQWSGQSNQSDPSCKDLTPHVLYQTAQFWYNMIRWVQPNSDCFTIDNGDVVIW